MHRIIAIGEILWDVFPDGPRFGGAPANFGCSVAELAQQSAMVSMVSAVDNDSLGHDALDALKSGASPDIIVLDLNLPDVTGMEGLLRLKSTLPETPRR